MNAFRRIGTSNGQDYYKDDYGEIYVAVNKEGKRILYTSTDDGEPIKPAFGTEYDSELLEGS